MYFVYRFIDKRKNVIYVGKSKQPLAQRFGSHTHLPDECYKMVRKIEYIECPTEADMSIREIYYINLYRNNPIFFNLLDNVGVPAQLVLNDKWKMYRESLPGHFSNSINFKKGYTNKNEAEIRYTKSGEIDRRKSNKKMGVSSVADSFSAEEVNLMIDYYINQINAAENYHQEQIRYRNLVMFLMGVNLPIKLNTFLHLKYKDVFDENDCVKPIAVVLNRTYKDEVVYIPLPRMVKSILEAYRREYQYTFARQAEAFLFNSRQNQVLEAGSCRRILREAAIAVGIDKNISGESMRKTYGANIYREANDKLKALVFLEKMWGYSRYDTIIKYLQLIDGDVENDCFFGERFSLGVVDFSSISCIRSKYVLQNHVEKT